MLISSTSGCGLVGKAPVWGTGDREFKSRQSDEGSLLTSNAVYNLGRLFASSLFQTASGR